MLCHYELAAERCPARYRGNLPRNQRSAEWQTDDDMPLDLEFYCRLAIEQLDAWLDGFKALLVRYETSLQNWLAFPA